MGVWNRRSHRSVVGAQRNPGGRKRSVGEECRPGDEHLPRKLAVRDDDGRLPAAGEDGHETAVEASQLGQVVVQTASMAELVQVAQEGEGGRAGRPIRCLFPPTYDEEGEEER